MHNKTLHMVAFVLLAIGGLNWLLFGLFQWEIGALFGGSAVAISRIIYILFGLAAVYELATHKHNCGTCKVKGDTSPPTISPAGV